MPKNGQKMVQNIYFCSKKIFYIHLSRAFQKYRFYLCSVSHKRGMGYFRFFYTDICTYGWILSFFWKKIVILWKRRQKNDKRNYRLKKNIRIKNGRLFFLDDCFQTPSLFAFLSVQNEWVVFKKRYFSENETIVFENDWKTINKTPAVSYPMH